jgi:hypothetical protein
MSYGDLFIFWTEFQFLVPDWGDEPAMASSCRTGPAYM